MRRQDTCGKAESGERAVVGPVQPQRTGARVTTVADAVARAVPYVSFAPVLRHW
ncbi:hypothetical protein ACIRNI_04795 [Streptomyces sp. NPDC093546]|uniref:hypothetical protein n=1 Tax=Streptomyces sp. NPDC093546 TaxID=3366040 RepID=UPI00382E5B72